MALPRILNPSPPSSHEVISSARVSENLVILPVSPDPTPQLAPALENIPLHSPSRSDFEPFAESESTSATAHTPPILGVDPQIVEALKSKERLYVLKLGEQMESLINDRRHVSPPPFKLCIAARNCVKWPLILLFDSHESLSSCYLRNDQISDLPYTGLVSI